MATELILKFNMKNEVGSGPATIDTDVFSTPAITYSGGVYSMTLSPMKLGSVKYYVSSTSPYHIVSKDGLLSPSSVIQVSADATDITTAVGDASSNFHAFLLKWVSGGEVYRYTAYVKDSDKDVTVALLADATVKTYLTCEGIIEDVFVKPVSAPGNYTYTATALDIYVFSGYWLQTSPTMAVYKNGTLLTVTTDYAIEFTEAGVEGENTHIQIKMTATPASSDVVVATYTWRHDCAEYEDVSVYEIDKQPNTTVAKDVNGRNMVTESYQKFSGFVGRLVWPYARYKFWETLRAVAEADGSTIDVTRVSIAGQATGQLTNLYITNYPKWVEEPGVVDVVQEITLDVVEIE